MPIWPRGKLWRCCKSADRQRRVALDLFHHGVGPRLLDSRQRQQTLAEEPAVGGHIGDPRLHQIIETAGDHVTFQHFRRVLHGARELLEDVRRGLVEQHLDEDEQAETEAMRIEPRAIALDKTFALQALQPFAD